MFTVSPRRPATRPALALISALFCTVSASEAIEAADDKPVQVYLLAGQSNMDGFGGLEALGHQIDTGDEDRRALFRHLRKDGEWVRSDDVWMVYKDRKGALSGGFGVGAGFFGVEWGMGLQLGKHHGEKVLLVKTSWGGASIRRKFRPPSSGSGEDLARAEYDRKLADWERKKEKKPEAKKPELEDVESEYGVNYRRMVDTLRETLDDIEAIVPGSKKGKWKLAGFVWFQGYNDQFGGAHEEYGTHLANLIRDVRKEFASPKLPVVIGQMGHGGSVDERKRRELKPIGEPQRAIQEAQARVAESPEFRDTVRLVRTDVFWDWKAQAVFDKGWREHVEEWKKIGAHFPYHYLGSPYTFFKVGDAFGGAMIELQRKVPSRKKQSADASN